MKTTTVTLDGESYVLSPLTFAQYEGLNFEPDGSVKTKRSIVETVNASLGGTPDAAGLIAGHTMKLFSEVLRISGLSSGEAKAAEAT